jgi:hypothetical protein
VRGRRTLRTSDTKTFDKLVPFLKPIDQYLTKPFGGVSLIAIASPILEEAAFIEETSRVSQKTAGGKKEPSYTSDERYDA